MRGGVWCLCAGLLCGVPHVLLAQRQGDGWLKRDTMLGEVVITSGKTEQQLAEATSAVTVITGRKLKESNIRTMEDIHGIVPNYLYSELGAGYQQQVSIRGVSVFSETPATVTYIDGVPALDVTAGGLRFVDVEKIEVLRGPQGTFYGRNAMGGVIHITTRKPKDTTELRAEVSLGNQGLQRYAAGVQLPVVKGKLFVQAAGQYQVLQGFYKNDLSDRLSFGGDSLKGSPADGKRVGDEASWYGNVSVRWLAARNWEIALNAKTQYDHSIGASSYYQAAESDEVARERPYKLAVDRTGSSSRTIYNQSLMVTHRATGFRFSSVTTRQHIRQAFAHIDQDLWPYDLATGYTFRNKLGDATPHTTWSQEFRFTSPDRYTRLQWAAGVWGFRQDYDKSYAVVYERLGYFFGVPPGTEITRTAMHNTGGAVFGQGEYLLGKRWYVTAGIRGDYEDKRTDVARYRPQDDGERLYDIPDTMLHSRFSALNPKLALRYKHTDRMQYYASWTRGYRAGGNNMFTRGRRYEYAPEYSDNFELGQRYRSANKLFSLRTALYLLYWRDLQLDLQAGPGLWIVDNVGQVRSAGIEIEGDIQPLPGMYVDLALGVNDARYLDFEYLGASVAGNRAILAPRSTVFAGVSQFFPLPKKSLGMIRAEWRRTGAHYFDLANTIYQPAYHVLNLRLSAQKRFAELSCWVRNLTNSSYLSFAMPGYFKYSLLNRPRTYGLTVAVKF